MKVFKLLCCDIHIKIFISLRERHKKGLLYVICKESAVFGVSYDRFVAAPVVTLCFHNPNLSATIASLSSGAKAAFKIKKAVDNGMSVELDAMVL